MGLFSGWFKKNNPEDYEQALASLALDIQKRQTRLSEIRLRERRSTLLFSVYTLAMWVLWSMLWYSDYLPNLSGHPQSSGHERTVKGIPVFLGPIVILFIRRIVQIWYRRTGDAEEKALVTLRKQQREKIEEIKKKTNYYSTRNLLERYDDGPGQNGVSPLRKQQLPTQGGPATPQRGPQPHSPQTPAPQHLTPSLQQQLSPSPQRPMPPPRKQWFDKLADAILGDDDGSASAASSRYALICQKCFNHNGLVKESMWEDAQYVCPKCGYFNPSARSMRQARSQPKSVSPNSRAPPAAVPPSALPTQHGQPQVLPPIVLQDADESVIIDSPSAAAVLRKRQRREGSAARDDEASSKMDIDS